MSVFEERLRYALSDGVSLITFGRVEQLDDETLYTCFLNAHEPTDGKTLLEALNKALALENSGPGESKRKAHQYQQLPPIFNK